MIEIKNTKVRLYTIEEYKKESNVTTLRPNIEETLKLVSGAEVLLYHQTLKDRYTGVIIHGNTATTMDIYESMIKEVIDDKPKIRKHCTNCRYEKNMGLNCIPIKGDYSCWKSKEKTTPIDTGAKTAILGDMVLGTFNPEEQSDGLLRLTPEKPTFGTIAPKSNLHVSTKPPLGIAPKKFYEEMANVSRMSDILDAMDRYVRKGCVIHADWIDELRERIDIIKDQS